MKLLATYLLFVVIAAVSSVYIASADSGGRPGISKKGCGGNSNCHSATADPSVAISLTFDSLVNTVVVEGRYNMTLRVKTSLTGKHCGGFDLKATGPSTLVLLTESQYVKGLFQELLHKKPLDLTVDTAWHFIYQARNTPGNDTLNIAALVANCDGTKAGDVWDTSTIVIPVLGPQDPYLVAKDHLDFDPVDVGLSDTVRYSIWNAGAKSLVVSGIHLSSNQQFKLLNSGVVILSPNDSSALNVIFTPDSIGEFKDTLYYTTTDPKVPSKTVIALSQGASAVYSAMLASISSAIDSGTVDTARIEIHNGGNKNMEIDTIIYPPGFFAFSNEFPGTIYPNQSGSFSFYVTGDHIGIKRGVIRIKGKLNSVRLLDTTIFLLVEVVKAPEVSVLQQPVEDAFIISPNPASSSITIRRSDNTIGHMRISVFDIWGRKVNSYHSNDAIAVLPVEMLASGSYILEIESGVKIVRRSFIKQ
jgi:hypothetical protein